MKYLSYVNAAIGTENCREFSHGNISPLVTLPHAVAAFTLQNQPGRWHYQPRSRSADGIRLTHQPSPWIGDYGQLLIKPSGMDFVNDRNRYRSSIRPEEWEITPALLHGKFVKDRVEILLVPTESGCILRVRFEDGEGRVNLIGLDGETAFSVREGVACGYTTAADHRISYDFREWFAVRANKPYEAESGEGFLSLIFHAFEVELRLAISYLGEEQALLNLERETGGVTLEETGQAAEALWEDYLSRIRVQAPEEVMRTFYSCMYRAFLFPRRFHELGADGKPIHRNLSTGEITPGVMYVDNGFWDTFRTVYPFLSLIDRELEAEMLKGFLNFYRETGWLPRWLAPDEFACMPGTLIEAVIADAVVKDVVGEEDARALLEAMLHNAETEIDDPRFGRKAVGDYRRLGYVPNRVRESVNETLDCCYGDFCISAVARKLGEEEIAARYEGYARNYRKLFDAESGFMRGRDEHGGFAPGFDPFAWGGDYTEGSAWHSSFAVYHDVPGLNALYGGRLSDKLDDLFRTPPLFRVGSYGEEIHEMSEMAAIPDFGQCAICNQPSFHLPYLYAALGDVPRTADLVHRILARAFKADECGFPGDEDNGTMAAWYLFSALGFYPLCPGKPEYTVSRPYVSAELTLWNGNTLCVSPDGFPISPRSAVAHSELLKGGYLAELVK